MARMVVASSSQQLLGGLLLLGLSACGGPPEPACSTNARCLAPEVHPAPRSSGGVPPVLLMGRTGTPELDGWQFTGDSAAAAYEDLAPHLAAAAQALRELKSELWSGLRRYRPLGALERLERPGVGWAHHRRVRARHRAQ